MPVIGVVSLMLVQQRTTRSIGLISKVFWYSIVNQYGLTIRSCRFQRNKITVFEATSGDGPGIC